MRVRAEGPCENNCANPGRRGARPARREERAYRAYVSDEQRSPAGCIGGQDGAVISVRALRAVTASSPTTSSSGADRLNGAVEEFFRARPRIAQHDVLPKEVDFAGINLPKCKLGVQ